MADPRSDAEHLVRSGDPRGALVKLTEAVKAKPADAALRVFLAQLLCVLGQWERAHTQLNVVAEMDKLAIPMRETVGHAIRCELLRDQVFAGKRTPMVFGAPDEWLAMLIESLLQVGQGNPKLSEDLAQRAFDAAPTVGGQIDGRRFEWIADMDSRLGPVLEACVNGRYYWVPFSRLSRVAFEAPVDLRDYVWTPAQLTFANGGETVALVPTRYPGSQSSEDGLINLARKTEWLPAGADRWHGLGLRMFATDFGEHDLTSVRLIELDELPSSGEPAAGGNPDGETT
jgi:type VI secretion system protein ImpE